MDRRKYLQTVSAIGAAAVAGCSGQPGSSNNQLTTVNLGTAGGGSTGVLAEIITNEGIDEEYGISLDLQTSPPPQVQQLVINKGVDFGFLGPKAAAEARLEGRNVSIFGSWLGFHNSLMASDPDIESWDDLVGERIGMVPSVSQTYVITASIAAEMGYDFEEDFDLRTGNPNALHSFDANGDVAAHIHFLPPNIRAMDNDEMNEVYFLPDLAQEEFGRQFHLVALAAYQETIEEDVERARKLRQVISEGQRLLNENPEKWLSEYSDTAGYDNEEQIQLAVDRTSTIYPQGWDDDTKAEIRQNIELFKQYGYIAEDAPTDIFAGI